MNKNEKMKLVAAGVLGCCETCIFAGFTIFMGVITKECFKRAFKKEVK
jgi:hypothetical protein